MHGTITYTLYEDESNEMERVILNTCSIKMEVHHMYEIKGTLSVSDLTSEKIITLHLIYDISMLLNEYFEQRKNSFCNFGPYSKPFGDKDVVLYSN